MVDDPEGGEVGCGERGVGGVGEAGVALVFCVLGFLRAWRGMREVGETYGFVVMVVDLHVGYPFFKDGILFGCLFAGLEV